RRVRVVMFVGRSAESGCDDDSFGPMVSAPCPTRQDHDVMSDICRRGRQESLTRLPPQGRDSADSSLSYKLVPRPGGQISNLPFPILNATILRAGVLNREIVIRIHYLWPSAS